jgi:DNA-binding GntR family transcriptional regulator
VPNVIAVELAQVLSDRIVFLELPPGTRIPEEELSASFGVSRSPIREVFRILEADGLVIRTLRKGVSVTPMSRRDLDEVYACRVGLEGLAAAEAARRATPDDRQKLKAHIARMRDAFGARDVRSFFETTIAYSRFVHLLSQNKTLLRIMAGIEKQAMRYRYMAHLQTQEMLSATLEGHSNIAAAILRGDATLARKLSEQLIRQGHALIARALAESQYGLPGDSGSPLDEM